LASTAANCASSTGDGWIGRQLLETVIPVGQPVDAPIGHRAQQLAAGFALLETRDGRLVVEQERQVEHFQLRRIFDELGQRGRQHLHLVVQQCLHLVGVADQRRIRVHLDLDLAGQALAHQLLEQQRALALRRVVADHVGELDDDGFRGLRDDWRQQQEQRRTGRNNQRLEQLFTPTGNKLGTAPRELRSSGFAIGCGSAHAW